jgi:hypothetical protein
MKQMTRFAAMFAILLMASTAIAQTNSNTQTVNLNATVAESLTISLGAVNTVNFTPVPGNATNAGDSPVSVTTTWILKPGRTAVGLYASFATPAAAMVHQDPVNTVDIPSSAVEISVNGGAAAAVNQTYATGITTAGGSLRLFNQAITGANKNSSRTDTLSFNLNLSSAAMQQLPADDYVGTMTLQAQATP